MYPLASLATVNFLSGTGGPAGFVGEGVMKKNRVLFIKTNPLIEYHFGGKYETMHAHKLRDPSLRS